MLNMTRQLIISLLCLGFCLGLSATQATATTSHLQVRVVNPEGLKPTKPVDPPKHMSSIPKKTGFHITSHDMLPQTGLSTTTLWQIIGVLCLILAGLLKFNHHQSNLTKEGATND